MESGTCSLPDGPAEECQAVLLLRNDIDEPLQLERGTPLGHVRTPRLIAVAISEGCQENSCQRKLGRRGEGSGTDPLALNRCNLCDRLAPRADMFPRCGLVSFLACEASRLMYERSADDSVCSHPATRCAGGTKLSPTSSP